MAKNIYDGSYAENTFSSLLAGGENARAISVAIAAGEGEVKRGSIIKRGEDGTYTFAANTDVVATNSLAVLDEDVNATTAVTARAWQSGIFMPDKLMLKSGSLTVANETALRGMGIMLKAYEKSTGEPSATITE